MSALARTATRTWLSGYRLVPLVLVASAALLTLKVSGLTLQGGYTLGERMALRSQPTMTVTLPATASTLLKPQTASLDAAPTPDGAPTRSWMKEMFNYPDVTGSVGKPQDRAGLDIVGGASGPAKPAVAQATPSVAPPTPSVAQPSPVSPAERAVLERLQQRRQELEAKVRELDLRDAMMAVAEKKLDAKLNELKQTEGRIVEATQKREESDASKLKSLVTMYESMKPKDAAKIFDRLDGRVLLDLSGRMAPRKMSEILALMSPEAAERLTVEMARAASGGSSKALSDLPKIEGRPGG